MNASTQNSAHPTIADIEAAAADLKGAVLRTQFLPSRTLSAIYGCEIWLKFENHQFTASFKERGALNNLLSLWRKCPQPWRHCYVPLAITRKASPITRSVSAFRQRS